MKLPKQFVLAVLLTVGLFFTHASTAVAQNISQTLHATDAGTVINLKAGDTIQFFLDENLPNTTPWLSLVAWRNIEGSIQEIGEGIVYDFKQTPYVATAITLNYYGVKAGQTILMFYKNSTTSTTNSDGSTTTTLADSTHPMTTALTFIVNVN